MNHSHKIRGAGRTGASLVAVMTMTVAAGVMTTGQATADHGDNSTDRAAFGFFTEGTILNEGPFPEGCAAVETDFGQCTDTEIRTPDPLDPLAAAGVFNADTQATRSPLRAQSSASVAELIALPDTPITVTAEVVQSQCTARVADGRPVVEGETNIAGLTIAGQPVVVPGPGEPQTIEIPLDALGTVTVIFNEQLVTRQGSQIVVNAVHITADLLPDTPLAIFQDVIIASSQCSVHPAAGATPPPPPPGPGTGDTGFLEICKEADHSSGRVTGRFKFRFAGRSVRVPVGGCSAPVRVPAGRLAVKEVRRDGFRMSACRTQPVQRLKRCDPRTRTAVVKIVAGGVGRETTLFVTNKRPVPGPNRGSIKVCKVAGNGVRVGENFRFTVGGRGVTVPAGPASQGGYCKLVRSFQVGTRVAISEAARPGVRVSRIAVAPADRRVATNKAQRRATVKVGRGYTVVTFTNRRS